MFHITEIQGKTNKVKVFDTDDYTEQFIQFQELYKLLGTYPDKFTDTLNNKRQLMQIRQYGMSTTLSNYIRFGKYAIIRTKNYNCNVYEFYLYYNYKFVRKLDYFNHTSFLDMGNEVWIIYDNSNVNLQSYLIWRGEKVFDIDKALYPHKLNYRELASAKDGGYSDFTKIDIVRPWEQRYTLTGITENQKQTETGYNFTFHDNYTDETFTVEDLNIKMFTESKQNYETLLKVKAPTQYANMKNKLTQVLSKIQLQNAQKWVDEKNIVSVKFSTMNEMRHFNAICSKYLTWSVERELYELEKKLGCMELQIYTSLHMYALDESEWTLRYITLANYYHTYKFYNVSLQGDILIQGGKLDIVGKEKTKEIVQMLKDAGLVG